MSIKAIYFDIGGVLVRTEDRRPRQQLAERLGLTYDTLSELVFGGESGRRAQLGEITSEQQWAHVCRVVGWPLQEWRALEAEFFAGDRLDTALLDFIRSLRPRCKTGIISNALDNARRLAEEVWGMRAIFDTLVFSAEVGVLKPDVRIFQRALSALRVQPAEALFVDDSAPNVAAAQAVGMRAIQFLDPQQVRRDVITCLEA